jgi:hypothetical protein
MKLYSHDKKSIELLQRLMQGFILSLTKKDSIVLTIKSDAALLTSIIKGCPIQFELSRNKADVRVIIEDNSTSPFFMVDQYSHPESLNFNKYDEKVLKLIKSTEIKLLLYNESNYQIVNVDLSKLNYFDEYTKWTESGPDEFLIKIFTRDLSSEESIKYIDIYESKIWNDNLINGQSYFEFNEYLLNGKHGYNQEFSVRTFLSEFFIPNEELHFSPKKTNDEELTDFIIEYKKAVVLIESKYTISEKQSKFNDAVVKATDQLNLAEDIIYDFIEQIKDSVLREKLNDFKVVLKICLFNDDGRDLKKAFKNVREKYSPDQLPIFISVSLFKYYLTYSKIKNGEDSKFFIINNLLKVIGKRGKDIIIFQSMDSSEGLLTFVEFEEENTEFNS